jgi:hypothetical protein
MILSGFCFLLISFHELGHFYAFIRYGYKIQGVVFTIFGSGILPYENPRPEDANVIYLSGLVSVIIPIIVWVSYPDPNVFILLFFLAGLLSTIDIIYLIQEKLRIS